MNLPGFKFWSTVQVAKNTRSIVRVSGLIYTVLVEKNVSRSRETTHRTTRTLVLYYAGTSVSCAPVQPSQLWCNSLFLTYFSACSFVVSWLEIPMSCTTTLEIVADDRCRTEMEAETRSARDHAAAKHTIPSESQLFRRQSTHATEDDVAPVHAYIVPSDYISTHAKSKTRPSR